LVDQIEATVPSLQLLDDERGVAEPSQRRAICEGGWLALSYGKLDDAADVVRLALPRLSTVRSPRSVALLTRPAQDLRRCKRNRAIADLLPELEAVLARHRG
jgi:hypothetical protein